MEKDTKNNDLESLSKKFIKWAKTEKIVPVNLTSKYRKKSHSNQLDLFVRLLTEGAAGFYSFPRKKKWENPEDAFYREVAEETGCKVEIIKYLGVTEEYKYKDK